MVTIANTDQLIMKRTAKFLQYIYIYNYAWNPLNILQDKSQNYKSYIGQIKKKQLLHLEMAK